MHRPSESWLYDSDKSIRGNVFRFNENISPYVEQQKKPVSTRHHTQTRLRPLLLAR